ncbi:MAG: HAD-IA family hydrolase [Phycisphaerae bacterium]|jgi:FMN phosphatase YigB (HAD superfamily)
MGYRATHDGYTVSGMATSEPSSQHCAIRCVCFDWGGVILRHCRGWAEACLASGVPLREGMDDPVRKQHRQELNHLFQIGRISEAEFFPQIAAATGGLYTEAEVRRLHHGWLLTEYAGVSDIIDAINAVGHVQTALLSNTNAAHWARHMDSPCGTIKADYPAIQRITHRHASHLLGHAKPHGDIYRAFEDATGFGPGDILFFDDLPDNIAMARQLGWHAVLIDHTRETAPQLHAALLKTGVLTPQTQA